MILKYLLLSLVLLFGLANADPLEDFYNTIDQQDLATVWVRESTKKTVSQEEAYSIVKEVYAKSISRDINPLLVLAVIKNESNFKTNAKSKYARGLMQVIPKWHKDKLAGRNPLSVSTSIDVGTWILQDCLIKHKGVINKALSCYSGGGGNTYYKKVMKSQYALSESVSVRNLLVASK